MNPLLDEYFKRDLTDAEEQQLAEGLSASPEDAERFAKGLEEMYLQSGQPAPVWPGGTMPPLGNATGLLKPLIPSVLILLLLGFSAYKWFTHVPAPASTQPEAAPMKKIQALAKIVKKIHSQAPSAAKPMASAPAQGSDPLSPSSLELPSLSTAPAASLPSAQPQGHLYQQLSVVVEPTAPSLATVRVLDSANNELRILYAGIIPAGRRTFTWDGKTTQGTVAPPGAYYIEVKSGEKIMRQEVKVEGN